MVKRYFILLTSILIVLFSLSVRLFGIGIVRHNDFASLAVSQQTSSVTVRNLRGGIYDRNMIRLTDTCTSNMYLSEDGGISSSKTPFVFQDTLRYSPDRIACHIIGHTDSDSNGISGIEKAFDSYLKSESSSDVSFFANATGAPVGEITKKTGNNTGSEVVLTIDYHIQKIAEATIKKYIPTGAAVIMDTSTFDILACASTPTFDASSVKNYLHSDGGELVNRAFMAYNAGSVFKIITSAAALSKNPLYHHRNFWCDGMFLKDSQPFFECHKKEGHGALTMAEAFAQSCNCAFYETGICTGAEDICATARSFGLGSRVLNMDISESAGNIPNSVQYCEPETLNLSIGQGEILITPLQCTLMCATVANAGVRRQANLVKSVVLADGTTDSSFYSVKSSAAISPGNAYVIASMMREAVKSGTASSALKSNVSIAGKTGSAQTGWQNSDGSYKVHGWFCGFFPFENPKYAMTVFCEDGKSGAQSCVRPFVEIAESIMKIYPQKSGKQ